VFGRFVRSVDGQRSASPGQGARPAVVPPGDDAPRLTRSDRFGRAFVCTAICPMLHSGRSSQLLWELVTGVETILPPPVDPKQKRRKQEDELHAEVIVDLTNVQFIDSACLGSVLQALRFAVERRARVAVVAGGSVESVFRLTRLDRMFPVCRDFGTAQRAVARPAA